VKKKYSAKFGVALSAALMLLASTVTYGGPNGAQHIEGSFDWPAEGFYFSCLNDYLTGTVFYTIVSHTVETPSGNVHMITNFFGTGHIYSLTTGETWTQKFSFPEIFKVLPRENTMIQGREKFIPDDPHGTRFFIEQWYKVTVNANDELVVYRDSTPIGTDFPSDVSRCAGKK
jgi:hypothetical protein